MNLPFADKLKNLGITKLAAICLVLLIAIFLVWWPASRKFLKNFTLTPIDQNTPITRLSLINPQPDATVSSTATLTLTLSNSPKITEAALLVNKKETQTVFFQQTDSLNLYWDTTKVPDGKYNIEIRTKDTKGNTAAVTSSLNVKNDVSRNKLFSSYNKLDLQ